MDLKNTYMDMESSSLILHFYDIIKTAMAIHEDPADQKNDIISKIPEVKKHLDQIILTNSYYVK